MVYRGKPSKGCQKCRERKIRCDLRANGCEKCEIAGFVCSGYRDEVDIRFLDQTEDVIRKAANASTANSSSESLVVATGSHQSVSTSTAGKQPESRVAVSSPRSLPVSLEDRAFAYFVAHNFINHVEGTISVNSYFESSSNDVAKLGMLAAIKAVGCVELSAMGYSENAMEIGRREYSHAVQLVNSALSSATHVARDEVLMTIFILSTYETVACELPMSFEAWSAHVQGAAALLDLRGPAQFETPGGLRLFMQVVTMFMVNCGRLGVHIPEKILNLAHQAAKVAAPDNVAWRYFYIKLFYTNFAADVGQQRIADVGVIVNIALQFDRDICDITISTDSGMERYQAYATPVGTSGISLPRQFVFDNYIGAQLWGGVWTLRIQLHKMLRRVLQLVPQETWSTFHHVNIAEQLQASAVIIQQMSEGILASVPQHVGSTFTNVHNFLWDNFKHTVYEVSTQPQLPLHPLLRVMGGYSLIWYLWMVGSTDVTSLEQKAQVVTVLRTIGDNMAARQAHLLADNLEIDRSITI